MGEFFEGWRRKVGMVTLLMACVFFSGWIKSLSRFDLIIIPLGRVYAVIFLSSNGYFLGDVCALDEPPSGLWVSVSRAELQLVEKAVRKSEGSSSLVREVFSSDSINGIPYWAVTIALTLLSAFLLLSKPRIPIPETAAG